MSGRNFIAILVLFTVVMTVAGFARMDTRHKTLSLTKESEPDCDAYCRKLIECEVISDRLYDDCVDRCTNESEEYIGCVIDTDCEDLDECHEISWSDQCAEFAREYTAECPESDFFDLSESEIIESCTGEQTLWVCLLHCWDESETCDGFEYCAFVDCNYDEDSKDQDDDDDNDSSEEDEEFPEENLGGFRSGCGG